MEGLISTFHIDWKLMIAQVFNFGLVFLALYFLASKPLSKLIKERTEEITTGLENAKSAKRELSNASIKKEEIIKEAKNEAKSILIQSENNGKKIIKDAKDKAILEKEEIVKHSKIEIEKERQISEDFIKKEASGIVVLGIKKIIEGYVKKGYGDNLINEIINSSSHKKL